MSDRPHRQADQPRRRPRQGDRRGEVRRRVQRPGPRLRLASSPARSPGGRSPSIDASRGAEAAGRDPGLHAREPAGPRAGSTRSYRDEIAPPGSPFRPLYDAEIHFSAQPVALVVADTLELARYAASLVRVEYEPEPHATDLEAQPGDGLRAEGAGRASSRRRSRAATPTRPSPRPPVQVDAEYSVPVEHHNPMETFATTVVRDEDGKLTVYDKTQGVQNVRDYLCNVLRLQAGRGARRLRRIVGGAFGSGLRPQYQVFLAVLAARELKRSVRVVADPPADVQLRAPPDDVAARGARGVRRRHARGDHPRGDRRDLAVRGLQRGGRQLVGPALPLRQRPARAQGRPARPAHAVRHAGPGCASGASSRSSPRWTSSPSGSGSTRSSCG